MAGLDGIRTRSIPATPWTRTSPTCRPEELKNVPLLRLAARGRDGAPTDGERGDVFTATDRLYLELKGKRSTPTSTPHPISTRCTTASDLASPRDLRGPEPPRPARVKTMRTAPVPMRRGFFFGAAPLVDPRTVRADYCPMGLSLCLRRVDAADLQRYWNGRPRSDFLPKSPSAANSRRDAPSFAKATERVRALLAGFSCGDAQLEIRPSICPRSRATASLGLPRRDRRRQRLACHTFPADGKCSRHRQTRWIFACGSSPGRHRRYRRRPPLGAASR